MTDHLSPSDRQIWLETLELGLSQAPGAVPLLFERAKALEALGRDEEAEAGYLDVLARDPRHFGALNDAGRLLCGRGEYVAALERFRAAVAVEPTNPIGQGNLGYVLLRGGDAAGAVACYETALRSDPGNVEAHRGLALALSLAGREAEARPHEAAGHRAAPVATLTYRGAADPVPLLLLVSTGAGNAPLERLIDTRSFLVHKLTVEGARELDALPPHRLVVNAVGDADACGPALERVREVLARTDAPVINRPEAVAASGRLENARRLAEIPGVRTARIERVPRAALCGPDASERALAAGFAFPLLLRSIGFHAGEHFVKVETPDALAATARTLPGDEVFLLEYLDLRNARGGYAKFRMMLIDQMIYPLHAVVSDDWKVHFFSAAMDLDPERRALDRLYLEEPTTVLGERAVAQLVAIARTMKLEYGGIDFGLDAHGDVVLFEANATMVVARVPEDPMWEYRRAAVRTLRDAAGEMLLRLAAPAAADRPLGVPIGAR